jgi:UDP-glucose 4-epimerase
VVSLDPPVRHTSAASMLGRTAVENERPPVVVTGAGGFIGSSVVAALLENGSRVRAHCGPPGFVGRKMPEGVETASADITDAKAMRLIVAGSQAVIHLAGPASVRASFDAPAEYAAVHVGGTAACLQACVDTGVRRFVYISSADVYGRPRTDRVAEDHPCRARSPYAAAKIGAEHMVGAFAFAYGLEAAILRPFSIYGPGVSKYSLLWAILEQARRGGDVLLADLKPERDYCYVDDLAQAIVRASFAIIESAAIVNVGTGIGTSVNDLANITLRIIGRQSRVLERPREKRPGESEIYRLVADPSNALAILGWAAKIDLASGLRRTIDATP